MDWSCSGPQQPFALVLSIRVDGPIMLDVHADHQDRWLQRARSLVGHVVVSHLQDFDD